MKGPRNAHGGDLLAWTLRLAAAALIVGLLLGALTL
jgi:hypothetical protein